MANLSIALMLFLLLPSFILASETPDVIINEIAWMGDDFSFNNEWIELYNKSGSSLDLNGWILSAKDGTPYINLVGSIPSGRFYLLERTDDETVPNTPADLIYKGALSNSGEFLELYDNSGNLVDFVDCSSGWFAGNNKTKQAMERVDFNNWRDSEFPGGTPKLKNAENQKGSGKEESFEFFSQEENLTYPKGIIFNEIFPSPEGPDSEEEWIELFNQNSFEVNLTDWKIRDTIGATKTYTISSKTIINPKGYFVLKRPETKIALNNNGDGLEMLSPANDLIDKINYENAPTGKSYSRIDQSWEWSTELTPGKKNIFLSLSNDTEIEKNKEGTEKSKNNKNLAAIEQYFFKNNSFFSFLTAFSLAFLSGLTIFFLKRKFKV